MSTTVFATEFRNHNGTSVSLTDDVEVTLVRDGAMSRRSSHPRYLIDADDILAETSLRAFLDGDIEGDEDDLNTAVACTREEEDGETILVPFRVDR